MNVLRRYILPVVVLMFLLVSLVPAAPATAQPPVSTLVAIRTASHYRAARPFERVVFEFSGPVPQTDVRWVNQLIGDGSGLPVRIAGRAILRVTMRPAQAHNEQGRVTAPMRVSVGLRNVKEVVRAGDFEAVVTQGIGLAQRSQFRVVKLTRPSRVVIDFFNP